MSYWMNDGRLGVGIGDYSNEDAQLFIEDCEMAGLHPFHYNGRYFWEGPAVIVDGMGRIQTSVDLQQDNMGLDYVIYPVRSSNLITKIPENSKYKDDDEEEK